MGFLSISRLKPDDHTLYWVYSYNKDESEYDFDTTTRIVEARRFALEMLSEGWDHVFIWFGNEDGAFTDIDYVNFFN
jgi:hypothetical protein